MKPFHKMTTDELYAWIMAHNDVDGEAFWDDFPTDPDDDDDDDVERYRDELEGMAEELHDARNAP